MTIQTYYLDLFKRKTPDRFYVYVHYRESDGKPFYVGKGTGARAWNRSSRNKYWKRVVDKHGLQVEILFDHLNEYDAFQSEKDAILELKYFGYKLTNCSDGGEGASGYTFTDDQRTKLSLAHKGKVLSDEHKKKVGDASRYKYKDESEYLFVNINGVTFKGTKSDLDKTFYLGSDLVCRLFSIGNANGWIVVKDGEKPEDAVVRVESKRKGSNCKTADKTIYTFVNKDTEEVFQGTRMQLVEIFFVDRICLSQVLNPNNKSTNANGWGILGDNESIEDCLFRLKNSRRLSKGDQTIYEFIHKDGTRFTGTRVELCLKYNLSDTNIGTLFSKVRTRKSSGGWSLFKE